MTRSTGSLISLPKIMKLGTSESGQTEPCCSEGHDRIRDHAILTIGLWPAGCGACLLIWIALSQYEINDKLLKNELVMPFYCPLTLFTAPSTYISMKWKMPFFLKCNNKCSINFFGPFPWYIFSNNQNSVSVSS